MRSETELFAVATAAARNARQQWSAASDEDEEDVRNETAIALHQNEEPIDDEVAWATTVAFRVFRSLNRRRETAALHAPSAQLALEPVERANDCEPPRPGRPPATKYLVVEDLRAAVRSACLNEFRGFAGRPWSDSDGAPLWPVPENQGSLAHFEKEARELTARLSAVLAEIREFLQRSQKLTWPRFGGAIAFLESHLGPFLERAAIGHLLEGPRWDPLDGLAWIVAKWRRVDLLDRQAFEEDYPSIPKGHHGDRDSLTTRELAVIALLSGLFPRIEANESGELSKPYSVQDVRRQQTSAVAQAIMRQRRDGHNR